MTTKEVAKILGVKHGMIEKYRSRGWLPCTKIPAPGKAIPYEYDHSESDLEKFYARCEQEIGTTGRVYWKEKGQPLLHAKNGKSHSPGSQVPVWAKELLEKLERVEGMLTALTS